MLKTKFEVRGFTLVEIMVVVVIIGLLAAMAMAALSRSQRRTENNTVLNDLRVFSAAFEQYSLENGSWPLNTLSPKVIPVGMEGALQQASWGRNLPGGGQYDWEGPGTPLGVTAAISIWNSSWSDNRWAEVDQLVDDGVVTTGHFRKLSDGRMGLVLED